MKYSRFLNLGIDKTGQRYIKNSKHSKRRFSFESIMIILWNIIIKEYLLQDLKNRNKDLPLIKTMFLPPKEMAYFYKLIGGKIKASYIHSYRIERNPTDICKSHSPVLQITKFSTFQTDRHLPDLNQRSLPDSIIAPGYLKLRKKCKSHSSAQTGA